MTKTPPQEIWIFVAETEVRLGVLATALAPCLHTGDLLALSGDLGAGKTAFARSLIRVLCDDGNLDVPSPTFNLFQSYDTPVGPVAHFDLYRLNNASELIEIGWDDALDDSISLVEWPDRAGDLPANRLDIDIKQLDGTDAREFRLTGHGTFAARLARFRDLALFLEVAGWQDAAREHLHGDASYRSYELLTRRDDKAVLMNAPARPDGPVIRDGQTYSDIAKLAEDIRPFVAIANGLKEQGFRSPEIFAADLDKGFLLLEYFGSETIVMGRPSNPVMTRYEASVGVLVAMHQKNWPKTAPLDDGSTYPLPDYDRDALLIETELVLDWFAPLANSRASRKPLDKSARTAFLEIWDSLIPCLQNTKPVWVLRDFHSPNLHWLESEAGLNRIGLIDYQDAVLGHPAYDLVSLCQDARVDIAPSLETQLFERYCKKMTRHESFDKDDFARAYAILGAQRNSKILGIFVRLAKRDSKPGYLRHLPRISGYLNRTLAHPSLGALKAWYQANLPEALEIPSDLVAGF